MTDAETLQARLFSAGEGDRWFERNRTTLGERRPDDDGPLQLLEAYGVRPRSVLEVGAANGYRLWALAHRYGCRTTGVEPSAAAVADGLAGFPGVRLIQGRGDAIPLAERFDLVVVNFVLHWVDRSLLLRTVAEIDRCVADDGYLIVGDFLPASPIRRPYHHLPGQGVYTYKQDYAAIFTATGCYQMVAALTSAGGAELRSVPAEDPDRTATTLLRKRLHALYRETAVEKP